MDENSQNPKGEVNREHAIFSAALEQSPEERAGFLKGACMGDEKLRQRLEALLEANENPESLLGDLTADATHDSPFHDESVGQTLGHYKLLERVGEGGYGVVYVAEQTEPLRRRVALKVIKLGMDTKQVVARFEAERQALALMDHPNIAKVLDAGTTDQGRPYFVMELVRGIKITDYCDQEKMSTKDRLDLFIKVCHAIQHAHQKGIIHRDIKPSNILVTLHDGVPIPKVIDFGIAKATEGRLTDATVYTQLHQFIGTPAYMSPEQAEMSGLDIDTRSDIYSLGVLLYELLIGKTPFDGKELVSMGIDAMRKTIRESEPARPSIRLATFQGDELSSTALSRSSEASQLSNVLRGDLDWIVIKCLEKDRQRRYETANGLAADIKRHLSNEPVLARPPSVYYKFQKAWKRNKIFFTAALFVAIALSAGISISVYQALEATKARNDAIEAWNIAQTNKMVAELQKEAAEIEKHISDNRLKEIRQGAYAADMKAAQQYILEGNLGVAQNLLSKQIPQPEDEDLRGWEWRYLTEQAQGNQLKRLKGHSGTVSKLAFSPDGGYLVSLGRGSGELFLWNLKSGNPDRKLISPPNQSGSGIIDFAIVPGGERIAILTSGKLQFWNARLTQHMQSDDYPRNDIERFLFSPDGNLVYFNPIKTNPNDPDKIIVWHRESGALEALPGHLSGQLFDISQDGIRIAARKRQTSTDKDAIVVMDLSHSVVSLNVPLDSLGLGSLLFVRGDRELFYNGRDQVPRIINLSNSEHSFPYPDLELGIYYRSQIAINEPSNLIALGSFNHYLSLRRLDDFSLIGRLYGHRDEVWSVAISPDSQLVASGGQDKEIYLWSTEADQRKQAIPGSFKSKQYPIFSSDGRYMVLRSSVQVDRFEETNGSMIVIDLITRSETAILQQKGMALSFQRDDSELLILDEGIIKTFDTRDWTTVVTERALEFKPQISEFEAGNSVVVSRNLIAAVGEDGNIHIATLQDGTTRATIPSNDKLPTINRAIALSPDEKRVAVTVKGTIPALFGAEIIQMWELHDNHTNLMWEEVDHTRFVTDLIFTQDSRELISGSFESTLRIWDVETGQSTALKGHKRGTGGIAISPDQKTIASVNHDNTLKLWHHATGREMISFTLSKAQGRVGFSPDGRYLVAYGYTAAGCMIWEAPSMEEILTF